MMTLVWWSFGVALAPLALQSALSLFGLAAGLPARRLPLFHGHRPEDRP